SITVEGLGVTGKSFFIFPAYKNSAGLCIFLLQSSALLFCNKQLIRIISNLNQIIKKTQIFYIIFSLSSGTPLLLMKIQIT
ncbi:hypothetical protein CHH80_10510, partial [Bacillus sp. 7504-2]